LDGEACHEFNDQLSDQVPAPRLLIMKTRYCDFCGDETGACVQMAPCEARERLQQGFRDLRVEGRLGRALTPFERSRLELVHGARDRLDCRAALLALGARLRVAGRRLLPG
jgi:hypothetical protein